MLREERLKLGQAGALLGIVGNLVLAGLKIVVGIISSSHAVFADGLHSLSDFVGSFVLFLVVRLANRPSDTCHPYGHGKAEAVGAKVIGIIVIIAGFQVGVTALQRLRAGDYVVPGALALWVTIVSIVAKDLLFRYKYRLGKRLNSVAIMSSAWEHRSDAYSSVAVLVGVGLAWACPIWIPLQGLLSRGS